MRISILHPFTPEAVGLRERDLPTVHSQPHVKALRMLSERKGFECSVEYFTSKLEGSQAFKDGVFYKFYQVSFKWNGDHKKWRKQSSRSCLRNYREKTPDVTIINMSGHSSPFSYELSKIIRDRKKQYIAMVGGRHYSDNERNREYFKGAHFILVHTNSQQMEMLKMDLFKKTNLQIFPLGIDTTTFIPTNELNLSPNLLYVGRILELKRIELAIEALKNLVENGFTNAHLNIIGPVSSEPYYTFLKHLIFKLQLEKNVSFLGEFKHSELIPFFQQADLFTLPSKSESFGMVIVEAMACGTPVAAIYSSGGPEEIIEHGKDGILAFPENYCEEVLKFFMNKKYAREISQEARVKVEKNYNLNETYKSLEEAVDSALNSQQ